MPGKAPDKFSLYLLAMLVAGLVMEVLPEFGFLLVLYTAGLFILYLVPELRGYFKFRTEMQRRMSGCCLGCGYDLRGNTSGVCPECGRAIRRNSHA